MLYMLSIYSTIQAVTNNCFHNNTMKVICTKFIIVLPNFQIQSDSLTMTKCSIFAIRDVMLWTSYIKKWVENFSKHNASSVFNLKKAIIKHIAIIPFESNHILTFNSYYTANWNHLILHLWPCLIFSDIYTLINNY